MVKMLILDKPRKRSPLLTRFYEILQLSKKIDIELCTNEKINTDEISSDYDYICIGYEEFPNVLSNGIFFKNHKAKIIYDMGDIEYFLSANKRKKFVQDAKVDIFLCRSSNIYEWMKQNNQQLNLTNNPQFWYVPWSIDLELYPHHIKKRNYDVSMICSIEEKIWKYHKLRKKYADALKKIKGYNIFIGNVYGNEYIERLANSYIFLCENSMRDGMPQKYLEAVACGCLLVGVVPKQKYDEFEIFEDGISMVSATPENLHKKIDYYIEHKKEADEICKEAYRRIYTFRYLRKTITNFELMLMGDLYG